MTLRTLLSLLRSGQLGLLLGTTRAMRAHHRLSFLAAGLASGIFARLAAGPVPLERLAADLLADPAMRDGLEAWLDLGVALGELGRGPAGYELRGRLARRVADPAHDDAAALIEETAGLHRVLILETPARLRQGRPFTLADQDGRIVARSSRLAEPFICEAMADVIPRRGAVRLLEIGCGSGAYIRWAAARNAELTAIGLELQPAAAALARENVRRWGLEGRVVIEDGDVRARAPEPAFDVVTLHQNIYYFPVASRVGVLRHVRGFLRAGGRLLVTTICRGRGSAGDVLDLWGAMTAGCGRLPTPDELTAQLEEAGFAAVRSRSLVPGESFHAFVGTVRAS